MCNTAFLVTVRSDYMKYLPLDIHPRHLPVFQAFDVLNKGCGNGVVMKIEPQEDSAAVARFSREADAYQRLSNIPGVATLYWHGYEHGYLAIALENLALDLRSIYNSRGSFFPLSMIMDLGVQMVSKHLIVIQFGSLPV